MSVWASIQDLSEDLRQWVYNKYRINGIPIDVRSQLAEWIEDHFEILSDSGRETSKERTAQMEKISWDLIQETLSVAQAGGGNLDYGRSRMLKSAAAAFLDIPSAELYIKFRDCLTEEQKVLQEATLRARVNSATAAAAAAAAAAADTGPMITMTGERGPNRCSVSPCTTDVQSQVAQASAKFSKFTLKVAHRLDKIGSWISDCEAMQVLAGEMQDLRREQKEAYELRKETELWRHPFSKALQVIKFVGNHQRHDSGGSNSSGSGGEQGGSEPDFEGLRLEREIQNKIVLLNAHDGECSRTFANLVVSLEDLVSELLKDYIYELKWSEVSPEELGCSFDDLRKCYTDLMDMVLQLHSFNSSLCHVIFQRTPNIILQTKLARLENSLRSNVLIVKEQPLQVLKTQRKFDTSVLFLGDERCFHQSRPMQPVKVSLINEEQAALLYQTWTPSPAIYEGCGTIVNNKGTEFTTDTSPILTVQFKNLSVSSVRRGTRGERNRLSRAMTEKFCLMYSTKFDFNGVTYEVWCCSVPFVLYVHVCQKPEGWATIFWDKFLHDKNRIPLSVPEKVPWSRMTLALTNCFKYLTTTEWSLTEANLNCIGLRIFKRTDFNDTTLISLQEIIEKENGTRNSFWDWFYAIIELTNKHLRPIWDKGKVVGFIDREQAEDTLKNYPPGTLMLRYSDTKLGSVSIVYRGSNGVNNIHSLQPFTDEDLTVRSLPDRIHDSPQFQYIFYFSNAASGQGRLASKDQVFKKRSATPENEAGGGEADGATVGLATGEGDGRPYKRCRVIMVIDDPPGISASPPAPAPAIMPPITMMHQQQIERRPSPFTMHSNCPIVGGGGALTPQHQLQPSQQSVHSRMIEAHEQSQNAKIDRLMTMVGTLTERMVEVKTRLQTLEEGMAGTRMSVGFVRRKLEEKQKKKNRLKH